MSKKRGGAVFTQGTISVGNLILNVNNYRIVAQDSQKATRDAIIAEQGEKLVALAKDIIADQSSLLAAQVGSLF